MDKRNLIIKTIIKKSKKNQNIIIHWICHYSWLKILKEKYIYIYINNESVSIKKIDWQILMQ